MTDATTKLIEAVGMTYCGYCNCTGTRNLKYNWNGYVLYYLPKRKTFHIKHINNYIVKNKPITALCEQLRSLGLTVSKEYLEIK